MKGMEKYCLENLNKYKAYAPVVIRVVLGLVFLAHGYDKLQNVAGVAGFFTNIGIPAAGIMAWVVTLVEFLGGIALIVGLCTRYASALIAVVMIVATIKVKLAKGFVGGYELDLSLLAMAVSLMLTGSGPYSLEGKFCKKKK